MPRFAKQVASLALFAGLLFSSNPAQAKDSPPIALKRVSNWEVNYEPDACHLTAKFGSGPQELIARFTRYQTGESFDLSLFGNPVKVAGANAEVEVGFGLADKPAEALVVLGSSGERPMMLFNSLRLDNYRWPKNAKEFTPGPAISPEQEARVSAVTLRINARRIYRLETGAMAKPMAAMRACLANLIKYWGFDEVAHQNLTRGATPSNYPGRWLTSDDYPSSAMEKGAQGLVQFRLDVSETGSVTGCRVLYKTSPDDFADTTCRAITRRAKLLPALDAAGKPIRSFYINKVRWALPY
jgi:TonB family protein